MSAMNRLRSTLATMILQPETSWWGYALGGFHIAENNSCPTMALCYDAQSMRPAVIFNSEFVNKMTNGQIAAVLMHELGHFLQMAFQRREMRDPMKWNVAADGVINYNVDRDVKNPHNREFIKSIKLPDDCIRLPDGFDKDHLYSEWVYDNMNKDKGLEKMWGQVQGGSMVLVDDHSMWGTFNDVPEEVLKSQIVSTIQGATKAAGIGSTPNGAEDILKLLLETKVDWRNLLRAFVGQNQRIGFHGTWKRPSRRFGRRQQGKTVERAGKLVFVVDTSGSMSNDELAQVMTEVNFVSRTYNVWVIDCDSKVQQAYPFKRGMEIKVKGRGGTDMNPGLKHADKDLKADMIVCLTDGGLFRTPEETRAPQLWIITPNGSTSSVKDLRHVVMRA